VTAALAGVGAAASTPPARATIPTTAARHRVVLIIRLPLRPRLRGQLSAHERRPSKAVNPNRLGVAAAPGAALERCNRQDGGEPTPGNVARQ
jgi:hypothetical protein